MTKNYSSMSAYEQRIYQTLMNSVESYQTECTFYNASFDDITRVCKMMLNDHPEYFWITNQCNGHIVQSAGQTTLTFRMNYRFANTMQIRECRRTFDNVVNALIRSAVSHASTLYEQILFLHDYMVLHTDYVLSAPHRYDAYGCLVQHQAVCDGYSAAFKVLMQKLGVECGRATGFAREDRGGDGAHSWNYIRLDDGYYYVDVTWDDPFINNRSVRDHLSHDFFCIDGQELLLTHQLDPGQSLPRNFGKKYNYYQYHGLCLDYYSFSAVQALAVRQLQRGNSFDVKFRSKTEADKALYDLFTCQKVFSIPGIGHHVTRFLSGSGLILTVKTE